MLVLLKSTNRGDSPYYGYRNKNVIIDTDTHKFITMYDILRADKLRNDRNIKTTEEVIRNLNGEIKKLSQDELDDLLTYDTNKDKQKYEEVYELEYNNLLIVSDSFINTMFTIMLDSKHDILANYGGIAEQNYFVWTTPKYLLGSTKELLNRDIVYLEAGHKPKLFNVFHDPMRTINGIVENVKEQQKRIIRKNRKSLHSMLLNIIDEDLRNSIHYTNNRTLITQIELGSNDNPDLYNNERFNNNIRYIATEFIRETIGNIIDSFEPKKVATSVVSNAKYNFGSKDVSTMFALYILIYLGRDNIMNIIQEFEAIYNELVYDILRPRSIRELIDVSRNKDNIIKAPIITLYDKINDLSFPEYLEERKIKNANEVTNIIIDILRTSIR